MSAETAATPRAENGVLFLGRLDEIGAALVRGRWPFATLSALHGGQVQRIDLSGAPRGAPGYEDGESLALLSLIPPGAPVVGFFCDAGRGVEGVRVFAEGREEQDEKVVWARPAVPDPLAWLIGRMALQLQLPIEAITRVTRPARPALALAIEALLHGEPVPEAGARHEALQVLGGIPHPEATRALARALRSADWVDRFHAARAYAARARNQGQEDLPRLETLLGDEDESVRQAALEGIAVLVGEVAFADQPMHRQIDAAIARGLADADDDVRAAAQAAQARRRELLG